MVGACPEGGSTRIGIAIPADLAPLLAAKGSITLDGVSLTVNEVREAEDGAPISRSTSSPTPRRRTTFGDIAAGRQLNVEVDVLARYIDRMMPARSH